MDLVELAVVGERRLAPRPLDDVDRLRHAFAAVVASEPVAHEFVLVVDRALADADIDAALAEIVQQRQLHGESHRMVEGHLHHGEADADLLGLHGKRRGKHQRVVVDALAGEIVLGEPDVGKAHPFGGAGLVDDLVDAPTVLGGRGRHGEGKPTEFHEDSLPERATAGGVIPALKWRSSIDASGKEDAQLELRAPSSLACEIRTSRGTSSSKPGSRSGYTSRRPDRMIRMTSRKLAGGVWSWDLACGASAAMAR